MELKDKIVVVTGGGMGIGKAIALEMAKEGANICIIDINVGEAESAAEEIRKTGSSATVYDGDVSNASSIDDAATKILYDFGRTDILVNNAGISHPSGSILDIDLDFLHKVTDIDWKGVYICSQRFGREMVERRSGAILNISSIAWVCPLPLPIYGPMKAAVVMLTQILARDWAAKGVRVNAIAPGYVLTPLLQGMFDKGLRDREQLLNRIPMREFIMPEDIAAAAVFLCSEKAHFITGATLPIDAGFSTEGGWGAFG